MDKLILFYVLTGNFRKLRTLQGAFQQINDNSRRFLNTIYTGNVAERVNVLSETGHCNNIILYLDSLATVASEVHGLTEQKELLEKQAQSHGLVINQNEVIKINKNLA